jgi:hypothetical protein
MKMVRRQTKQATEKPVRRCDPDYAIELLRRMNLIETWTKKKIDLKKEVIRNLKIGKHVIFEANYGYYGISRVGQHYHDSLIDKKQGHMRPLAGRDILFVCIGSGMRAKRLYMATAIPIRKASKKKN